MFSKKVNTLMEKKSSGKNSNSFVTASLKKGAETTSGNGALKYSTSGNQFLDQFGNISNYRQIRSFDEISRDMNIVYSIDKEKAIALILYIRMITRNVTYFDGSKSEVVQRGQGLKNEAILRMLWVAINDSDNFWNNIHLFISAGSWKDIITMMSLDLQYHGWNNKKLDWEKFSDLIIVGLENKNTSELVKKYLPQIKATSKCKTLESQADTIIAKFICSRIFGSKTNDAGTYKKYRKLKGSGKAHVWQQLISKKLMDNIDFNSIHGRALSLLVSSKFLKNNGLEDKYMKWIEKQPVAKYTGYVYELMAPVKSGYRNSNISQYQIQTINKQFMGLVETAKKDMNTETRFICALDTSSSMTSNVPGLTYSSYDVAKSVALFFSYLLDGEFSKYFYEFNSNAKFTEWIGNTPVDRLRNDRSEAYGSTNFMGIAQAYIDMRRRGISEDQFPNGIIAISDGCFDEPGTNETTVESFKKKLLSSGFSEKFVSNFTFVFWDIPNGYYTKKPKVKFETFGEHENVFYMSGFDPSGIAFLMGGTVKDENSKPSIPKSADELMDAALSQEIMKKIVIS